jgi:uncharacterized repeat protein (TIGR03803 family)
LCRGNESYENLLDDAPQCNGFGCGTVFSLTPPASKGRSWTEAVICAFPSVQGGGARPVGGVVFGKGGSLYGTTELGGASNAGTVFALVPTTNGGAWTHQVLYEFTGEADGAEPIGTLAVGPTGTLYGTASIGGNTAGFCQDFFGCGVVFAVVP